MTVVSTHDAARGGTHTEFAVQIQLDDLELSAVISLLLLIRECKMPIVSISCYVWMPLHATHHPDFQCNPPALSS